jgi:hypothetical protein
VSRPFLIVAIVLQNAAKHGKLMENLGDFDGAGLGAVQPSRLRETDFYDCQECCKNIMQVRKMTVYQGVSAEAPNRISFNLPGGISCI